MQENKMNKEPFLFKKPQGFRTIRIHLTAEAIEWLEGATKDDGGNTIGNHTLFYDLLSRMRLTPDRDASFRRPQELQPGQFQFSETRLAEEWNVGREKSLQSPCNYGTAGHDSGRRFQNRFRRFHDLCRELDGLSELPRHKPLQSRPEWHLNHIRASFIRQRRHATGEPETSFSFEICQGITSLRSVIPWRSRGTLSVHR